MKWCWSLQEDEAMDYLPHHAQVLYLRILRRRMDFASGIVGVTTRLSYQMIAEWMEERPVACSTRPLVRLTVGEIRAAFTMLEREGLIERVKDKKRKVLPLVFRLPLATVGLIREKYEQQKNNQKNNTGATAKTPPAQKSNKVPAYTDKQCFEALVNAVDNIVVDSKKVTMSNSNTNAKKSEEQHTSGIVCLSLNNNINARARGNGAVIENDWLPDKDVFAKIRETLGLPTKFIHQKAIEFRIQWQETNTVVRNWDRYFFGACKNKIAERDGEFLTAQMFCKSARSYEHVTH